MTATIETSGLRKAFGKVQALDGLDLSVPRGTVCAPTLDEIFLDRTGKEAA